MSENKLTPFRKRVRDTAKDYSLAATVVDAVGSFCSVRLAQNGQLMTGLKYSGVKPEPGKKVQVDFISGSPIVLTGAAMPAAEPEVKPIPPAPVNSEQVDPDYSGILRYHSGEIVAAYPANEEGMQDALDDCIDDDLIVLPVIQLTMDVVMPDSITIRGDSRETSFIYGHLTMGEKCKVTKVSMINAGTSFSQLVALTGSKKYLGVVSDCDVLASNCGVGGAVGLMSTVTATTRVSNCFLSGEGISAWAVYRTAGYVYLEYTKVYGLYYGDVHVYGTYEGEGVMVCDGIVRNPGGPQMSYRATLEVPGEMVRSLAGITAMTKTQVAATPSGYAAIQHCVSDDYIYTVTPTGEANEYIFNQYQVASPATAPKTCIIDDGDNIPLIAMWDKDTLLAVYDNGTEYVMISMDFSIETPVATEIDAWPYEAISHSYNQPDTLVVAVASTGTFALYGGTVFDDTESYYKGYVRIWDGADGIWMIDKFELASANPAHVAWSLEQTFWPQAAICGDKVVLAYPLDTDDYNNYPSQCALPVVNLDAYDGEQLSSITVTLRTLQSPPGNYSAEGYHSAVDIDNNCVYWDAAYSGLGEGIEYDVIFKLDLTTGVVSVVQTAQDAWDSLQIIGGSPPICQANGENSVNYRICARGIDGTPISYWTDPNTINTERGLTNGIGYSLDVERRMWVVDQTNSKIIGYLITDPTDKQEVTVTGGVDQSDTLEIYNGFAIITHYSGGITYLDILQETV